MRTAAERAEPLDPDTALAVLDSAASDLPGILAVASSLRTRFFGRRVHLCSILNARSGACSEDCSFCAQSARHATGADVFPLVSGDRMRGAFEDGRDLPISHFGVVTSGEALDPSGVQEVCRAVSDTNGDAVNWCASLGALSADDLRALKEAGVKRFHHNIETAPSFFTAVCKTHGFEDRLSTIRRAKKAGLEVCSGGILGLGESRSQRVEMARLLFTEGVDSIPLNFLVPIPGTPLENATPMEPLDILRSIAMFRLTNPRAEVKVCAGRHLLRDLQSMIFAAGATGMMIGPLLTVAGGDVERDLQMIRDLELQPVSGESEHEEA
ncbi:MAG: biotin synthase BioB [Lentisphaerae bacterium]|nr:biotin synthase BioB [Lentisphaerota bacterium]